MFPIRASARISTVLLDDILDCLSADLPDPEFSQLAEDPRVAETCFLRDAQHDFPKFRTFRSPCCFRVLLRPFRFANPPIKRLGCDDRDQFFGRVSQRFAEFEQPRAFLWFRVDLFRQPRTGNANPLSGIRCTSPTGDPSLRNPLYGRRWGFTLETQTAELVAAGFAADSVGVVQARHHFSGRDFRVEAVPTAKRPTAY